MALRPTPIPSRWALALILLPLALAACDDAPAGTGAPADLGQPADTAADTHPGDSSADAATSADTAVADATATAATADLNDAHELDTSGGDATQLVDADSTDDADAGYVPEIVEFTVASGDVELAVRRIGGEAVDADVVVLINGGPGFSRDYMATFDPLAAPDRMLVTYNQRGMAPTTTPQDDLGYLMNFQVADVEAIRLALEVDRLEVLGHSWGGAVAARYAIEHPDRVAHLYLVSSVGASWADITAMLGARNARVAALQAEGYIPDPVPTTAAAYLEAIEPAYFSDPEFVPPPEFEATTFDPAVSDATFASIGIAYDIKPDLATLEVPLTLVIGADDLFGMSAQQGLRDALRSADIVGDVVVPAAGHYPWFEQPDATFAALGWTE